MTTHQTIALVTLQTAALGPMFVVGTDRILGTGIMNIAGMLTQTVDAGFGNRTIGIARALNCIEEQ